jgi:hypothetical protein
MGFRETLAAFVAAAAVLGFALWQDRRPWRPGKPNWIPLMIFAAVATIVFAIHLGALLLE